MHSATWAGCSQCTASDSESVGEEARNSRGWTHGFGSALMTVSDYYRVAKPSLPATLMFNMSVLQQPCACEHVCNNHVPSVSYRCTSRQIQQRCLHVRPRNFRCRIALHFDFNSWADACSPEGPPNGERLKLTCMPFNDA